MEPVNLWRAVLHRAWLDALGVGIPPDNRVEARSEIRAWLDTPDFNEVCVNAQLHPARQRARFTQALLGVEPCAGHLERYGGLAPDVVEELRFTQLDRPSYVRRLRKLDPGTALARVTEDLDRGLRPREART